VSLIRGLIGRDMQEDYGRSFVKVVRLSRLQINWYDNHGNLVNDATYRSTRMRDSKLFEARSSMTFTPRKEHHNQTFRCEAWNEAGDNLRPALARLFVQYAPSVTVTPVRPGMVQEGDKVHLAKIDLPFGCQVALSFCAHQNHGADDKQAYCAFIGHTCLVAVFWPRFSSFEGRKKKVSFCSETVKVFIFPPARRPFSILFSKCKRG
jgi:hypothetical protein